VPSAYLRLGGHVLLVLPLGAAGSHCTMQIASPSPIQGRGSRERGVVTVTSRYTETQRMNSNKQYIPYDTCHEHVENRLASAGRREEAVLQAVRSVRDEGHQDCFFLQAARSGQDLQGSNREVPLTRAETASRSSKLLYRFARAARCAGTRWAFPRRRRGYQKRRRAFILREPLFCEESLYFAFILRDVESPFSNTGSFMW